MSEARPGRIVIAGASGFLGFILASHFNFKGRGLVTLSRNPRRAQDIFWDGKTLGAWTDVLNDADVVINLAGRTVNCRYTSANRREIMESRVDSTRVLGEAISKCVRPPRVWLNASTATIYKHTFGPAHNESGEIAGTPEAQDAFSVEVAQAWERELEIAKTPSTRKVAMRMAMVMGWGKNSVFPTLLNLARWGLGGRMGSGRQFVSWIHETDFVNAIEWLIAREDLSGPTNVCAPNPVTNAEMMQIFREAARRPFGLPAEEWMLEIGARLMGTETELILKSRRVAPKRLLDSGFKFKYLTMREAVLELASRT